MAVKLAAASKAVPRARLQVTRLSDELKVSERVKDFMILILSNSGSVVERAG
jgi:hypothetical protein